MLVRPVVLGILEQIIGSCFRGMQQAYLEAPKPETYKSKAKVFDTSLSEELLLCIRKMKLTREQAGCRGHSGEATLVL